MHKPGSCQLGFNQLSPSLDQASDVRYVALSEQFGGCFAPSIPANCARHWTDWLAIFARSGIEDEARSYTATNNAMRLQDLVIKFM